jgi:hypothetical protein
LDESSGVGAETRPDPVKTAKDLENAGYKGTNNWETIGVLLAHNSIISEYWD